MDNLLIAVLIHDRPGQLRPLKGAACEWSVESYCLKEAGDLRNLIARDQLPLRSLVYPIWNKSDALNLRMANSPDQAFNITDVDPLPHVVSCVSGTRHEPIDFNAQPLSDETVTLVVHSSSESDGVLSASVLVSRSEVV